MSIVYAPQDFYKVVEPSRRCSEARTLPYMTSFNKVVVCQRDSCQSYEQDIGHDQCALAE